MAKRVTRNRKRPANTGTLYKRDGRGPYIARWYDHTGKRKEVSTGTTDKAAAERILSKRLADAALRRDGVVDARVDRYSTNARKPLLSHLADFIAGVKARGVTAQQTQQLETRIRRVLALAHTEHIPDLNHHDVQMAIGDIRNGDDEHGPASLQTAAHYLRNVKQFTRWLRRDGRVATDPLADMEAPGNPETDRRRVRRALTADEAEWLIRATEQGPRLRKMSGTDRGMMYRIALGSGFRAGEVKSLTPESFDLDAEPPTVTVAAAYSKHRQTDVQPIHPELGDMLAEWLKGKPAGKPVFPLKGKAVAILRRDLENARTAWLKTARNETDLAERKKSSFLMYMDAAGKVADFHSLRHTYVSALVAGGASVKTCQELARHSNPLLTIGRYSHVRLNDLTGALDTLPCPAPAKPTTEAEELRATGTCDIRPNTTDVSTMPDNSARQWIRGIENLGDTSREVTPVFCPESRDSEGKNKKGPGRGNRGHRLAIARSSSDPGRGKPG